MSVLTTIPDHYPVQYESSFDLALQQKPALLRGAVTIEPNCRGRGKRLNNLGQGTTVDITTRGGATVMQDLTSESPWLFPTAAEAVNGLDEFDEVHLGEIVMPGSQLAENQAYAINRKIDNTIVAAATGTRYLGENGTTTDALPSSQQVAAIFPGSTSTGLNFEKIARAAKILDTNEVPMEDRYLGIRAQQMEDLVLDIIANHSTDLSSIRTMPGTRVIEQILGFKVLQCERFAVDGSDICSVLAWQKSQLVLGIWSDRKTYMDIRADLRHTLQVRTTVNVAAVRRRNEGVVEILCDQSPA